ncbi:MAG: methyltransferase domain-containing protein [Deltaproteobacteria bacterium]|nr:methyltransferase domain-containing protein [Deltaproteobacteria bacterium]
MKARAADLLACPRCLVPGLNCRAHGSEGDEILEGELSCGRCGDRFAIRNGVPRILPDAAVEHDQQRTVDRFGRQWNDFDFLTHYYEQQFLGWIGPNRPEDFKDKIVLEGGCGKGRHSSLVSSWGAKDVIAVDLGSAVDTAFRNCRHLPNVHVVQADLFRLPVAPKSVDIAFSVGVLHHTPRPKEAFLELVARVKTGGRMIAWVYGRENNEWIVQLVDPIRKNVTSRLPHRVVYEASKVPAALLWAVSKGVYKPLRGAAVGQRLFYQAYVNVIAEFPFDEVHSIVHDHLTPPIAHYIERSEFEDWFREAGLVDVHMSWHNENSWRGTGTVASRPDSEIGIDRGSNEASRPRSEQASDPV